MASGPYAGVVADQSDQHMKVEPQPEQHEAMVLPNVNNRAATVLKETPLKTPVSLLQETLSRRGITPSYELVQIEGAIHEPTFRYRVSFNDKDAMGAGKSKKEAKHAAAKALIEKLADSTVHAVADVQPSSMPPPAHEAQSAPYAMIVDPDSDGNDASASNGDDQIAGNPIGWLQEQCMVRRWPPPTYETEMEVGLPHQRQFTIACCVLKLREIGQGKSKKIAKRLAAHKMFTLLAQNPDEQGGMGELGNAGMDESRAAIRSHDQQAAPSVIPVTNAQNSFKVSQFHRAMKATRGPCIDLLQRTCLGNWQLNYVQVLHEIAREHLFEVTYVDIEERTVGGQHQCFVQLSTLPVAVVAGQGDSYPEAQRDAAHNALQYLKVMTKV